MMVWADTGAKTAMYNDADDADENDDEAGGDSSTVTDTETQYLIKWKHWSHIHNTWESEASLREQKVNGMKKLDNYCKRDAELQQWYVPALHSIHRLIQCVRKKRDQSVSGNISYKTRAILMKFGKRFPE